MFFYVVGVTGMILMGEKELATFSDHLEFCNGIGRPEKITGYYAKTRNEALEMIKKDFPQSRFVYDNHYYVA